MIWCINISTTLLPLKFQMIYSEIYLANCESFKDIIITPHSHTMY